jgi:NADP-dependent 3-hydroxy acid dehydrogenase YdfG
VSSTQKVAIVTGASKGIGEARLVTGEILHVDGRTARH